MRHAKEVRAFMRGGPEPKVNVRDMAYRDADGPEERAVLRLACAIHRSESGRVAVSWSAQERAGAFFNAHGLATTLDECERLECLTPPAF